MKPAPQVLVTPGGVVSRRDLEVGEVILHGVVGLPGDAALEAADDLQLALVVGGAALGVGACGPAVAQAGAGEQVAGMVGRGLRADV